VKRLFRFTLCFLLFGSVILPTQAAFTSLYVFGDSVTTTTSNTNQFPSPTNYYGHRFANGRVWVEVLAERQGITYESNKNWSYFGHTSTNLLTSVNNFSAVDANTSLFAVWVCNADMFYPTLSGSTSLSVWTNAINQSQTNHFKAITNLFFAKGARTIIMPNGVDVTLSPNFSQSPNKVFIRQRISEYQVAFSNTLNQLRAACPGITIYGPDMFALFDHVMATPADYGLTKTNIAAVDDASLTDKSLAGPGANYVWWQNITPGSKFQMHIADLVQQLLSPVRFDQVVRAGASNQLNLANVPIGRDGVVEGSTNFVDWVTADSIDSTNALQSLLIPMSDPNQFYRLRFPFLWTWP
jgi:phospholipase/lecithinase/hemolysin